ncbi:AI-2E family transporter [Dietzia sp. SLG310A2-38A2]|uniref:AI-2E family transporter n=1 Tax=Dietzia sp. SLG310A2-38A2 TaxID=1630643 RepID=UPI0015FB267C|nr:AI-2E family transporter [Dietzia sp. SLG310A2-38A2]MBB1029468.1 AI-2E family transporter [Dietzia sp. SLG310A2-38A2]
MTTPGSHGDDAVTATITRALLPSPIVLAAAWSACLLLIAGGGWILGQAIGRLSVIIAPIAIAVLLAAMLRPVVDRVPARVPRAGAALVVVLGVLALVLGALTAVANQLATGFPEMREKLSSATDSALQWLEEGPLHLTADRLQAAVTQARGWIESHSEAVAAGAVQFGHTAVDAVAGLLICLVSLFFFLYHGEKLWAFFVRWFPRAGRGRADRAFRNGWVSLGAYTRTQLIVAAINAAGVGIGAAVLRVPFVIPIVVVVFLASFVPIIGILVAGSIPTVLALVERGPVIAVAMLAIVVVVHQLESHVLQPVLMGHAVSLHPLAVIVVVAAGTYLFGIVGALFAVPVTAMANAVVRSLAGGDGGRGGGPGGEPGLVPDRSEVTGPDAEGDDAAGSDDDGNNHSNNNNHDDNHDDNVNDDERTR